MQETQETRTWTITEQERKQLLHAYETLSLHAMIHKCLTPDEIVIALQAWDNVCDILRMQKSWVGAEVSGGGEWPSMDDNDEQWESLK